MSKRCWIASASLSLSQRPNLPFPTNNTTNMKKATPPKKTRASVPALAQPAPALVTYHFTAKGRAPSGSTYTCKGKVEVPGGDHEAAIAAVQARVRHVTDCTPAAHQITVSVQA